MTANPLTDQILAAFTETERHNPPPPVTRALLEDIGTTLTQVMPDLDPATIGQVLMHTGAVFNGLSRDEPALSPGAIFGANVLIGTGGRLYSQEPPPAKKEESETGAPMPEIIAAFRNMPRASAHERELIDRVREIAPRVLPGLDPAQIGEALMHCMAIVTELVSHISDVDPMIDWESRTAVAVNVVGVAGMEMFTIATERPEK